MRERDPFLRPRRRGISWKTRLALYLIAAIALLCAGLWLAEYVYSALFWLQFALVGVIVLAALVGLAWLLLRTRRPRRRW